MSWEFLAVTALCLGGVGVVGVSIALDLWRRRGSSARVAPLSVVEMPVATSLQPLNRAQVDDAVLQSFASALRSTPQLRRAESPLFAADAPEMVLDSGPQASTVLPLHPFVRPPGATS